MLLEDHCVGTFTWLLPVRCGGMFFGSSAKVGIGGTGNFMPILPHPGPVVFDRFSRSVFAEWQGLRAVVEGRGSGERVR